MEDHFAFSNHQNFGGLIEINGQLIEEGAHSGFQFSDSGIETCHSLAQTRTATAGVQRIQAHAQRTFLLQNLSARQQSHVQMVHIWQQQNRLAILNVVQVFQIHLHALTDLILIGPVIAQIEIEVRLKGFGAMEFWW